MRTGDRAAKLRGPVLTLLAAHINQGANYDWSLSMAEWEGAEVTKPTLPWTGDTRLFRARPTVMALLCSKEAGFTDTVVVDNAERMQFLGQFQDGVSQ